MKKLFLLTFILCACSQTQKKLTPEEAVEQSIRDISAPLIARDFVALDGYLNIAKDTTLSKEKRGYALDDAKTNFPGWMADLSLDNINTQEGQHLIDKQKELITAKYRLDAANQVREEAIEEQIKAGGNPQ